MAVIEIGRVAVDSDAFPEPAATLLRTKQTAALVGELGRNYERYHEALAARFDRIGEPRPEDYPTPAKYLDAFEAQQRLVLAEALLRTARRAPRDPAALGKPLDGPTPLWRDGRLLADE